MFLTVLLDQSWSAQLLQLLKMKMLSKGFMTVSDLTDLDIRFKNALGEKNDPERHT